MFREEDAIGVLRERVAGRPSPEGIGDDGAVLREGDGRVVVLDSMVQGVHFDLAWSDWSDVAYKLVATNVSDLWAMGAQPTVALLSLSLPRPLSRDVVAAIGDGIKEAAQDLCPQLALVGGDTTSTPGPAFLSMTLVGRQVLDTLRRDGLRPGMSLWVDGPLGWAAAGVEALSRGDAGTAVERVVGQHRRPVMTPPDFAGWRRAQVGAAMDISDGLAIDLHRMAAASGVAIELDGDLPGVEELAPLARRWGHDVDAWQLAGGDDYVRVVGAQASPGARWSRIGRVVAGPATLTLIDRGGTRRVLKPSGFRHFA